MLKIITDRPTFKDSFYAPPYFELKGEISSIVPLKPNPHDFNAVIGVYDAKGLVFEVAQNPSLTPSYLAVSVCRVRKEIQKEFFEKTGQKLLATVCNYRGMCLDPRVIMVHILTWWRCPFCDIEKIKIMGEAFTPPPTYEESTKWLTDNRFIGTDALHEEGYSGRIVSAFDKPIVFKNLPEKYVQGIDKICDLIKNDENIDKDIKEQMIKAWRIPKE